MNWLGDFFGTLPDVLRAAWTFIDGFYGVVITLGSIVLVVAFLALALVLRPTHGWTSAVMGAMAATVAMFWAFGIIPSAWVYFADGNRELLEGTIIPSRLPGAENFYVVFRDFVVIGQTGIALGALVAVALWVQRRFPSGLAEGEERGPTSGGYR